MGVKEHQINQLLRVVNLIYEAGDRGIMLEELQERICSGSGRDSYPPRTFANHKEAILEIFGLEIKCRAEGRGATRRYFYYISNREDLVSGVAHGWLINHFSIKNALQGGESIRHLLSLENIPRGQQWLPDIIEALKSSRRIRMSYKTYDSEIATERILCPYGLKVLKRRWYLIGRKGDKGEFRVYSLDRVHSLSVMDEKFKRDGDWSVAGYFYNSVGILRSDDEPQHVVLKVSDIADSYLCDLPIHQSQYREVREDGGVYMHYMVSVNQDLVKEIVRHGDGVEVESPESLRKMVLDYVGSIAGVYGYTLSGREND